MNWIEIATRNAKDILARIQESVQSLTSRDPAMGQYRAERIMAHSYFAMTLQDILLARNLIEAKEKALAVLLATARGKYSCLERTSTLRKAGIAFKHDHDKRSDEADQHQANLSRAIRGEGLCGNWEEVALVLLEERMVPPGGEAERFLLEELAGQATNCDGPTDRIRAIMVERGFRFCPACDMIAEPVTACGCLECPVCNAVETGLQSDEIPEEGEQPWHPADEMWRSIATKHKPECRWVQTRGYQLPAIPLPPCMMT